MKKPYEEDDELAPRPLDYSKAVRGKYYDRIQRGTNIVLIAPDLLDTFPNSEAVNEALRASRSSPSRQLNPRRTGKQTPAKSTAASAPHLYPSNRIAKT